MFEKSACSYTLKNILMYGMDFTPSPNKMYVNEKVFMFDENLGFDAPSTNFQIIKVF